MKLPFTKMHGCGNDYVYVDCFENTVENPEELAIRLSHRRFSIGGDGLILVCPSEKADAKMRMFNNDGSEGRMCGNGIRCVAKLVHDRGISKNNPLRIETLSGIKTIELTVDPESDRVSSAIVDMGAPIFAPGRIPTVLPATEKGRVVGARLTVGGRDYAVTALSMGNPHCVVFVEPDFDLWGFEIEKLGPLFEKHPAFPERVNTEFVKVVGDDRLEMRVWERGSGETWACGTGTCASVVAACLNGYTEQGQPVRVKLRGGELTIRYTDRTVLMEGPAVTAFEGTVEVF